MMHFALPLSRLLGVFTAAACHSVSLVYQCVGGNQQVERAGLRVALLAVMAVTMPAAILPAQASEAAAPPVPAEAAAGTADEPAAGAGTDNPEAAQQDGEMPAVARAEPAVSLQQIEATISRQLESIKTLDVTLILDDRFPNPGGPYYRPEPAETPPDRVRAFPEGWGHKQTIRIVLDGERRFFSHHFSTISGIDHSIFDVEVTMAFDGTTGYELRVPKGKGRVASSATAAEDPTGPAIRAYWMGQPHKLLDAIASGRAVLHQDDAGGVGVQFDDGASVTLWTLDPRQGYNPVHRATFSQGTPVLDEHVEYEEVLDAVWLPRAGKRTFFVVTPLTPQLRAPYEVVSIKAEQMKVNKPLKGVEFRVQFPEGLKLISPATQPASQPATPSGAPAIRNSVPATGVEAAAPVER